jgi:hypothetical protein
MVGSALLLGLPLTGAFWAVGGGAWMPSRTATASSTAEPIAATAVEDLPLIFIPIPTETTPTREAQTPVVLPGYLLPDDGAEEPSHAGS